MKKALIFKTHKGNHYLYSPARNHFILCHPLIHHLYELEKVGVDSKGWMDSMDTESTITLASHVTFRFPEIRRQWKKFRFLKRHHFFDTPGKINLNGQLLPSRVKENISTIRQVIFETTEDCNLSCTYCTYSKFYINKERHKIKFDTGDAKKALTYLLEKRQPEHKELMISFYGGEPLKNFRFIKDIVEFLEKDYGDRFSFQFNLTTNGLLLAKYGEFLFRHSFELSISLDGNAEANTFRVHKNNKPSFNRVISNTDHIKATYPDYFDKKVSFISVLHARNSHAEVHDFFKQRYGKVPMVSSINTSNVNENYKEEFRKTFLERTKQIKREPDSMHHLFLNHPGLKDLSDTVEKYSGFIFKNYYRLMSENNQPYDSREFLPSATCLPFSIRVFIAADGTFIPCEHISRIFEIGQIQDHEIMIDPDVIAHDFNRYFNTIRPLCDGCFLADNCKECVFNTRIETGQPHCDLFMDESRFANYLAQQFGQVEQDYSLYLRILNEAFHAKQ
ncbi:MAG: radical SAM peptide maturase [Bacteroidota bacterium]